MPLLAPFGFPVAEGRKWPMDVQKAFLDCNTPQESSLGLRKGDNVLQIAILLPYKVTPRYLRTFNDQLIISLKMESI
jgi:hypothetical protein